MNTVDGRTLLITAIEATMTVSALYNVPPVGVYSTRAARSFSCSFILKETQSPEGVGMAGGGAWSVSQLVFKVDCIGLDGVVDAQMKGKWLTGSVMKDMITPRGRSAKQKNCIRPHCSVWTLHSALRRVVTDVSSSVIVFYMSLVPGERTSHCKFNSDL